jgi:ankyrin repeat protein
VKWQLLHHACWNGDHAEVERLLAAGANPNQVAPTNWRQTPLGRTLEFRITFPKHDGHLDVVRTLLAWGADPAVRSTYLDMTPYELACFGGFQSAADLLLPYQDAAPPHPSGMPPLWLAAAVRLAEECALEAVRRLLVEHHPDCIWREATPLMMATGHAGHFRVADALLEAGADPDLGTSLLHADWHFEYLVPSIKYLAHNGWNVHQTDAQGRTALHNAVFCGYARASRTLLALGADPLRRDRTGATPADLARRARKPQVLKVLEGHGHSRSATR